MKIRLIGEYGKYDTPAFLPKNGLPIDIEVLGGAEEMHACVTTTKGDYTAVVKNGKFAIPAQIIAVGEIHIKINLLKGVKTIKSWTVEPLYITEIDRGYDAIPAFEKLKSDLQQIKTNSERILSEHAQEIAALKSEIDKIKNNPLIGI